MKANLGVLAMLDGRAQVADELEEIVTTSKSPLEVSQRVQYLISVIKGGYEDNLLDILTSEE